MKEPRFLFLITATVCTIYLVRHLMKGDGYNGMFWVAVLTIFFSLGSFFTMKKKGLDK